MVKDKMESDMQALPEPTSWARAVLLGTAVLGVVMNDRTLNAKNVELFGQKVRDVVLPLGPTAWALVQALEMRAQAIGANLECDRLRTAQSANTLCKAIAKAPAVVIVAVLASTRFETSSSAVQSSLATASQSLATIENATVISTLKRLAQLERGDLSAAKYLREARAILQQDEIRRSLQVELSMVVGAAEAYLSTGKQSMLGEGAFDGTHDYDFNTPAPPKGIANVVTPTEVVIGSKSAPPPPPTQPHKRKESVKKNTEEKTLVSEDMRVLTRVDVERRATGLDRVAARALLDEAYNEAVAKVETTATPMLVSVMLTCEVTREG